MDIDDAVALVFIAWLFGIAISWPLAIVITALILAGAYVSKKGNQDEEDE